MPKWDKRDWLERDGWKPFDVFTIDDKEIFRLFEVNK